LIQVLLYKQMKGVGEERRKDKRDDAQRKKRMALLVRGGLGNRVLGEK